jgi:precorrin-2 dehydrogenase
MKRALYPIALDLAGRPCLVIGGGVVAERKTRGLLDAGARVTVVGPSITDALDAWKADGALRHVAREYCRGDLAGFQLVFVATDEAGVSAAIAAEGRARGIWVNAADEPAHCDFHLPAVVRRGAVVVAVATGGTSPALARLVRDEIDAHLGHEVTALAEIAGEVRRDLRESGRRVDGRAWLDALRGEVRELTASGRAHDARRRLRLMLEAAACE